MFGLNQEFRRRAGTAFTEEEDEIIQDEYYKMKTYAYISELLDRPERSLSDHIAILIRKGILKRRKQLLSYLREKRMAFVERHYPFRGKTFCLAHLPISHSTLKQYLLESGLVRRSRKCSGVRRELREQRFNRIADQWERGFTVKEIAETTNMSIRTIGHWILCWQHEGRLNRRRTA